MVDKTSPYLTINLQISQYLTMEESRIQLYPILAIPHSEVLRAHSIYTCSTCGCFLTFG